MIDQIKRLIKKNRLFYYFVCLSYCICGVLTAIFFLMMRVFPIKKNKIVCCSMKGKRYGDSPKYIADALMEQNSGYEIVWLMRDGYEVDFPTQIRRAKYNFFSCAYELATAKFWIDSNSKQLGTLKRRGQYYIQTWHGSALKKLYGDIPDKIDFFDRIIIKYNSKIQDVMLSDSRFITDMYRRAFWYRGEILECGSPRNDVFFHKKEECLQKVRDFFHLTGQKTVLYAPTFRDDFRVADMRLDFERLKNNLEKKFDGDWVVLVRLHPNNIAEAAEFIDYTDRIINATDYSVMQELLVACDVLITDYSSSMFDYITKGAPCFIYATDIKTYQEERDFYMDLYELPFPVSESNDELEQNILQFDEKKYEDGLQDLLLRMGACKRGNACKEVLKWMALQK